MGRGPRVATEQRMTKILSPAELETITGGQKLNPAVPIHSRDRLLAQCGPQIDAYTNARQAYDADKTNTRKEIDQVSAGRSLALCATNAGFDPPPSWRSGPRGR
jgi:hypothetical protein